MWMILSSMKPSMILKQHDSMIYRFSIRSLQIRIKHQHWMNCQTQCRLMVFITMTARAIIIQILQSIKNRRRSNRQFQHPAIYLPMVTRSIIIQAQIDIGRDFLIQFTKGNATKKICANFFPYLFNTAFQLISSNNDYSPPSTHRFIFYFM